MKNSYQIFNITYLLCLLIFLTLLQQNELCAETQVPEGPAYCATDVSKPTLFYRQMVITGASDRVHDAFDEEFLYSSCCPQPGAGGYTPSSPGVEIEYTNWHCINIEGKRWIKWEGFTFNTIIPAGQAEQMTVITSPEAPDDAVCDCWFKYRSFNAQCRQYGKIAQWDFENCTGFCCKYNECEGKEIKKENNIGLPLPCE